MKRFVFWSLFLVILFHTINNGIWLALDNLGYILPKDINNLEKALIFFRDVRLNNFFPYAWAGFCGVNPPLYFLIPVFLIKLLRLPFIHEIFIMTNILYLTIMILSVYGIGKHFKKPFVGICAAIITSLFPGVFGFSRIYASNFALIGFFALFLLILLKTDYLKNSAYSILCGLIIGIAMLFRWTFIVFIFIPLTVYIIHSIKINHPSVKKIMLNTFGIIFLSSIIFLSWFIFSQLFREFSNITAYFVTGEHTFFGYNAGPASTYLYIILDQYLGIFFAFFFLLGLFYAPRKYALVCAGCVLFSFMCFSFIAQKNIRYLVPLLPILGLITAFGIDNIEQKYKLQKHQVFKTVILCGLVQLLVISYHPGAWKIYPVSFICRNTMKKDTGMKFILDKIEQNRPYEKNTINIGISSFVRNRFAFFNNIGYSLRKNTLLIRNYPAPVIGFCESGDDYKNLDFVLRQTVPNAEYLHPRDKKLYDFEKKVIERDFELIAEYTADTPLHYEGIEYKESIFRNDKNTLQLYKKRI